MRTISVDLDSNCELLTKQLAISNDEIHLTVNDDEENIAVATDDFSRFIAFREFPGGRIIMAECLVTEKGERKFDSPGGRMKDVVLKRVTVKLAIELRRELPTGTLSKDKEDGELNLAIVAQSFGFAVSAHPDEPPSTLYSGPWDGKPFRIMRDADAPYLCSAHIDRAKLECDMVWAIDLNRYLLWRDQAGK